MFSLWRHVVILWNMHLYALNLTSGDLIYYTESALSGLCISFSHLLSPPQCVRKKTRKVNGRSCKGSQGNVNRRYSGF